MITRLVKGTFNSYTCMLITATEKIGKYLCVISVVLLAADRFWVICNRRTISRRYRTYKTAIITLTLIWILTILISLPPTLFSTPYKLHGPRGYQKLCLITWPMYFKM
uniref:G-protein coupled receptors family 1 profile domain-containing protein n=1 Tax=Acrobeloides nanus TaxID=290746 RepID=A0A914CNY8_9BILA